MVPTSYVPRAPIGSSGYNPSGSNNVSYPIIINNVPLRMLSNNVLPPIGENRLASVGSSTMPFAGSIYLPSPQTVNSAFINNANSLAAPRPITLPGI
jgi:hypothetical protein